MIDWELNGDPYFYENRHTPPILIENNQFDSFEEYWIFYNTQKFSGKKLVVKPGGKTLSVENGVYNILVWQGKGSVEGFDVEAFNFGNDELLICGQRAVEGIEVQNTGSENLILFKFFGPDINPHVPLLKTYPED